MLLNNHSYFSLKYGVMPVKELLQEAVNNKLQCLALTDINNTSACIDFVRIAQNFGIRPVLGVDFRNGTKQLFVALAKNNQGFFEINNYLSPFLGNNTPQIPLEAPEFNNVFIIYPIQNLPKRALRNYEFVGVKYKELNKIAKLAIPHNKQLALQTASFRNKRDFNAHRLLRAIDNNVLLSKLPKTEQASPLDTFMDLETLKLHFASHPHLCQNAQKLLQACSIDFKTNQDGLNHNQKTYTNNAALDFRLLKKLCYQGISYRYGNTPDKKIIDRIENELRVIQQKGFVAYFLITWRIVKYARQKAYFYVGRGSGANSILSYLLRITDVDPVALDLYFERFINLFRRTPPDFDLDFSWQDREDITRYIFSRFPNVALVGAYSTFQYNAVFRELGKVFGLPDNEIKRLQKQPHTADEIGRLIIKYSKLIHGFPSHLTVHSAGILIADRNLHHFGATFLPPKGFSTMHFDMLTAEDLGLFKWDILGQRGLAKIKDALRLIAKNKPGHFSFDIHDVNRMVNDDKVKKLLVEANAVGCFYVESPAMRMLLAKLQVRDFKGLVAASSVIRPGVAKSGMMREFILRYRYPERREAANPIMMKIMPETYGVMVYQEDVIKVAHFYAGLSLAEADVLRRGMSGKYRSREEFQRVKEKFFRNCDEKGFLRTESTEIWRQIESFAGYAFAKGHSASYAVESYQCLFLKAYFPIEYMAATVNNGGGFYSREMYLHEARICGAEVLPPCINRSGVQATVEGNKIYLGFGFINELTQQSIALILAEREKAGIFKHFDDFLQRIPQLSVEQCKLLIKADCFRFCNTNKKKLLWQAHLVNTKNGVKYVNNNLFDVPKRQFKIPQLSEHPLENAFEQIELFGFCLSSVFSLLSEKPNNYLLASTLKRHLNKTVSTIGYLVTVKPTKTASGNLMYFGTFVDENGDFIDTVHFPPSLKKYTFQGPGCYHLWGKVTEDFDVYSLEIEAMRRLPYIENPKYAALSTAKKMMMK